jgi:DNA-binding GntR family transcriptional regulator
MARQGLDQTSEGVTMGPQNTGRSTQQRIASELRAQIQDGSLAPGAKLPTEAELTERHAVARQTARSALILLVNEGLIEARRPHGYFVRAKKRMDYRPQSDLVVRPADAEKDIFLTEQSLAGRDPSQSIDVSIVTPPPEVATRLALEPDDLAVVRRRVRRLDGEPFYTNDSYYPLHIAQGTEMMIPHDISRGANQVLAECGFVQTRALDEFFIRMPSPSESARLELIPGTPVAIHVITGYTAVDLPVRCVVNVLPGDKHVVIYDRPGLPASDQGSS